MRLLWVTPALPLPPTDGQRLIAYQLLRRLCTRHQVTLLSFRGPDQNLDAADATRELCERLYLIPQAPRGPTWVEHSRSLLDTLPRWVHVSTSLALHEKLRDLCTISSFDVVHWATGLLAQYQDLVRPAANVCAAYDSLTLALEERARNEPRLAQRYYWFLQAHKMRRYEKYWYARAEKTYVVASKDAESLRGLSNGIDVSVIPNGVDVEYFVPNPSSPDFPSVCFSGVMDYPPNQQAVLFFARRVLPRVWQQMPAVRFWLIGKNPTSQVRALAADPRVQVTGCVDDIRPFVARSTVVVCPIQQVGGIKNKLLEAMAMAKPVISTSIAAATLAARPEEDLVLADTEEEMAKAVLCLLNDPSRREEMGKRARAFVTRHHSWDETTRRVEELYREAQAKANRAGRQRRG